MNTKIITISILFSIFSCVSTKRETERKQILTQYIDDITSKHVDVNYFYKNYIIKISGKKKDKRLEYYHYILNTINKEYLNIDKKNISINSFSELNDQEKKSIVGKTDDIYVIKNNGKILQHIMFKKNKISSLNAMKKGELNFFIML